MLEKGSVEACQVKLIVIVIVIVIVILQAFIKKHSQNLHPNHYYLQVRGQTSKDL